MENNLNKYIKEKIKKLADSKYKEFHSSLCPGIGKFAGVRIPVLRGLAKEILRENLNIKEYFDNAQDEYYEEIMLQGIIIRIV